MYRTLIVEDDPFFQRFIKIGLTQLGYGQVDIASNIKEATVKISNKRYDLMVLDRNLPDGDGLEFATQILNLGCKPFTLLCSSDVVQNVDNVLDAYVKEEVIDDYTSKRNIEQKLIELREKLSPRAQFEGLEPILLAESDFFGREITKLFKGTDLEVEVCEDGYEAATRVLEGNGKYKLIIAALANHSDFGSSRYKLSTNLDNWDLARVVRVQEDQKRLPAAKVYIVNGRDRRDLDLNARIFNRDNLINQLREDFPETRSGMVIDPNGYYGQISARILSGKKFGNVKLGEVLHASDIKTAFNIADRVRPGLVVSCRKDVGDLSAKEVVDFLTYRVREPVTKKGLSFGGLKDRKERVTAEEIRKSMRLVEW